jgi:hypothetical protein
MRKPPRLVGSSRFAPATVEYGVFVVNGTGLS